MEKNISGLTEQQVIESRNKYGKNALERIKTKGFFGKFFENLSDPIIKILLIALVIEVIFTFGHCDFFEIGGIVAAILIATIVSTASECGSEAAFSRMEEEASGSDVRVLRDGEICNIKPNELVVGDIVYLYAGEKIQADGIMLEGRITVNQAALNGEGEEVVKLAGRDDGSWELSSPVHVFSGTVLMSGTGIMQVKRVGGETYYGMVARDVQTETRTSPLKLRLSGLASQISKLGYVMALLVGFAFLFNTLVVDNGFVGARIIEDLRSFKTMFSILTHALTLMITVIVVSTPEGLPMMITVVLSANMKKMLRDKILVKKLVGIETAGSLNILFTDKTGTITTGKLEVESIITREGCYKTLKAISKCEEQYKYLRLSSTYNTDTERVGDNLTGGNATDRAICEFFTETDKSGAKVKSRLRFNSDNKYSSVTLASGMTLYKGAAEVILKNCQYAINERGERVADDLKYVKDEFRRRICLGERLIGVGVSLGENIEDIAFVALISIKDKIRSDAEGAIKEVIRSGIQVVMITGDGKETATAIAEECGILTSRKTQLVLNSDELGKMSDDEVMEILPSLRVVSRALPRDKMRLVELSQRMNLVAGMTGDGINDAPSLKLADVGFAMGSGTDIAKGASDIVILDDSISAISKTVLYGRTIFKSIRKFISFQLIMNLAACGVSLVGQFIGIDNPITIIQMLWINIIMDTLGGLAFAGEAPLKYYMKEKPKRRDEQILSGDMLNQIAFTGAYTLILCVMFLSSGLLRNFYCFSVAPDKFYTAFYALFIFSGLFNCLCARCERLWIMSNISKNRAFIFIMLFISAIQISMIYFGGSVFRCTPLSVKELLLVIALAFTVVPFDIIRRILYKLK